MVFARRSDLSQQPEPSRAELARRKPQRITVTIPWKLYERLVQESALQGRSLSNLACNWLERQAESHPSTYS